MPCVATVPEPVERGFLSRQRPPPGRGRPGDPRQAGVPGADYGARHRRTWWCGLYVYHRSRALKAHQEAGPGQAAVATETLDLRPPIVLERACPPFVVARTPHAVRLISRHRTSVPSVTDPPSGPYGNRILTFSNPVHSVGSQILDLLPATVRPPNPQLFDPVARSESDVDSRI